MPAVGCAVTELVGLQSAVRFAERADGRMSVHHPWGVHVVRGMTPATRDALQRLSAEPVESSRLSADPEYRPVARFFAGFPFLAVRTVLAGGVAVLRLDPLAEAARPDGGHPILGDACLRLSRFALCRRRDEEFVVESPLAAYRAALLSPELAGLVAMLAKPCSLRELAAGPTRHTGERRLPDVAFRAAVHELAAVGLVDVCAPGGANTAFTQDGDPSLRLWSFHDLLFHARSRAGRYDAPSGATFPGLGRLPPLPAVKPPAGGGAVALPRPDLTEIAAHDVTFTEVLESRVTRRSHGPRGISVQQLGELLYRSLRIREHWSQPVGYRDEATGEAKTGHYELSRRPYPSGGSCHEFEVYPVVHRCEGLDAGIYHYDALRHELRRLHGPGGKLTELLGWYRPRLAETPDVLLIITSRFRRMSWKYESISYAVTLRNVGVLYQTLYLVATSMGIAACALGDGDTAVAERVLGLPFAEESTVGEFAVGSLAPPSPALREQPPLPPRRHVNDAGWARTHSRLFQPRHGERPTAPTSGSGSGSP